MPNQRYTPDLLASINLEITLLRQQLQQALAAESTQPPGGSRGLPPGSPAVGTMQPAEEIVAALDTRIERLEQVRDWIEEDQQFSALVDAVIGKQVQAAMRRQRVFNVGVNICMLIAGWLLSLIGSPASIAALFHR